MSTSSFFSAILVLAFDFRVLCTSKEYYLEWRRVMFEKLIFDCAVNVVGALHKFPTVGYVVE